MDISNSLLITTATAIGIVGDKGYGKSFMSVRLAFAIAKYLKRKVCVNFSLNAEELHNYFYMIGDYWGLQLLKTGGITCKSCFNENGEFNFQEYLSEPNTVYIFDEAGILLNKRYFYKTPPQFLFDLAQIRRSRRTLIWISQYHDQIDNQVLNLTDAIIWADGVTMMSRKLKAPQLLYYCYRCYKAKDYIRLQTKKNKFVSKILMAKNTWQNFIGKEEKQIFKCFPSFESIQSEAKLHNGEIFQKINFKKIDWNEELLWFDEKQEKIEQEKIIETTKPKTEKIKITNTEGIKTILVPML